MSENNQNVQLLTVTDSLYKHGDSVRYKISFSDVTIEYFGCVVGRNLVNDIPGVYYWEYIIYCTRVLRNGEERSYHDSDTVRECDLSFWLTC